MTAHHTNYDTLARATLEKLGKKIVMAVPLGIGKPIGLINAFYLLACADPSIELTIMTALTLSRPVYTNELEKRFVEPFLDRILGNYEDPLYEKPRVLQKLPKNIQVLEFFLTPGKYLHNDYVQQNYINSSYTNAIRDILTHPVNVLAQQVAPSANDPHLLSLSSNTDVFADTAKALREKTKNKDISIIAEVNGNLPFMYGDAVVHDELFTDIVDTKKYHHLFPMPLLELTPQDQMIGLYVSSLVKDDGCIQLGIGKMSEAVSEGLILRHENNEAYQELLRVISAHDKFGDVIDESGDTKKFNKGLYASTEMLSDGYLHLIEKGILKKKVYDDIALQKLAMQNPKDEALKQAHGTLMHAAFFIGSNDFYQRLRDMPEDLKHSINMTRVARTNSLLENPELYQLQRHRARFINSAMMVTLGGVVISDGLKDMQEVSGVGGQFDFVDMAPNLVDSRSIITCPAIRHTKKGVVSNIIWAYENITVPRYLRDIVVTEYGVADCRSKTDADIIKAMLNVADSRFQEKLLQQAKKAGKIPKDYQIPAIYKNNYPEDVTQAIKQLRDQGLCSPFPFGTDMTPDEIILQQILLRLKYLSPLKLSLLLLKSLFHFMNLEKSRSYLLRMQLLHPHTLKDRLYRRLLSYLLSEHN